MLDAMSQIALDHLREQLSDDASRADPRGWYLRAREEQPELLSPYLVEPPRESMSPNYYVLRADPQDETLAILEQHEFVRGRDERGLPWFKVPGNNSGDAGPVIKRNTNAGPKPSVTKQTFKRFKDQAQSDAPWAEYFAQATDVFQRKTVRFKGEFHRLDTNALDTAISAIPEVKATCFLSYADDKGHLPGERKEYAQYLQATIPYYKYVTIEAQPVEERSCSLCSSVEEVYPNALRGAGLNLTNVDRAGIFASLDSHAAWKKFALCGACADLLYVFSYHVRDRLMARVAGERALLVPYTTLDPDKRLRFVKRVRERYVRQVATGKPLVTEENKLEQIADEEGVVTSITILWANFGQELNNVRGMVTDVLPSRLRAISEVVREVNEDRTAPFPEFDYEDPLKLDVAFNYLGELLKRPGGKRTEKANKGPKLFDLKRDMAAAAYHGRRVPAERFWEEVRGISEAYLLDAMDHNYGLSNEGWNSRKGVAFLTMAGWVRHLCRFVYFLRKLEVYPRMGNWRYRPRTERLRESFGELFEDADGRTGIDSPEKAYAFLLGALFGKLIQVQGARGVNVGANALPWLKRFTLTGKDLPELYVKIREKLLTYGTESSSAVRDVEVELGHLGTLLGTDIMLNQTETGYFLLLGQSLFRVFMPGGEAGGESTGGEETA